MRPASAARALFFLAARDFPAATVVFAPCEAALAAVPFVARGPPDAALRVATREAADASDFAALFELAPNLFACAPAMLSSPAAIRLSGDRSGATKVGFSALTS